MSADYTPKSVGSPGIGPRTRSVSAFPGAPGAGSGVPSSGSTPIKSGVVGESDPLDGGAVAVPTSLAFPGYAGANWQSWQTGQTVNPSTVASEADPVSGGIHVSHPEAFPGGGQHV
jgi:hypothetical protein